MISLSELLGGRRRRKSRAPARKKPSRKKTTRKTTRKPVRRRGRGLVAGGLVGGDLALAEVYKALMGGAIGADPAVLNYYENLATRGGRKKRTTKRRSAPRRAAPRYSAAASVYDPESLYAAENIARSTVNERRRAVKLKEEEKYNEGLGELLSKIPRRNDPYSNIDIAAEAIKKAEVSKAVRAARKALGLPESEYEAKE